jgi:hypothetical protein
MIPFVVFNPPESKIKKFLKKVFFMFNRKRGLSDLTRIRIATEAVLRELTHSKVSSIDRQLIILLQEMADELNSMYMDIDDIASECRELKKAKQKNRTKK